MSNQKTRNDGLARNSTIVADLAHMWAYAEHDGLSRLTTEDFSHGRLYGAVLAHNPFKSESP
jgi:hypothetical protein